MSDDDKGDSRDDQSDEDFDAAEEPTDAKSVYLNGTQVRGTPKGCFGEEPYATLNKIISGYDLD